MIRNPRRLPSRQEVSAWFCHKHTNELILRWPDWPYTHRCRLCWRELFNEARHKPLTFEGLEAFNEAQQ